MEPTASLPEAGRLTRKIDESTGRPPPAPQHAGRGPGGRDRLMGTADCRRIPDGLKRYVIGSRRIRAVPAGTAERVVGISFLSRRGGDGDTRARSRAHGMDEIERIDHPRRATGRPRYREPICLDARRHHRAGTLGDAARDRTGPAAPAPGGRHHPTQRPAPAVRGDPRPSCPRTPAATTSTTHDMAIAGRSAMSTGSGSQGLYGLGWKTPTPRASTRTGTGLPARARSIPPATPGPARSDSSRGWSIPGDRSACTTRWAAMSRSTTSTRSRRTGPLPVPVILQLGSRRLICGVAGGLWVAGGGWREKIETPYRILPPLATIPRRQDPVPRGTQRWVAGGGRRSVSRIAFSRHPPPPKTS